MTWAKTELYAQPTVPPDAPKQHTSGDTWVEEKNLKGNKKYFELKKNRAYQNLSKQQKQCFEGNV